MRILLTGFVAAALTLIPGLASFNAYAVDVVAPLKTAGLGDGGGKGQTYESVINNPTNGGQISNPYGGGDNGNVDLTQVRGALSDHATAIKHNADILQEVSGKTTILEQAAIDTENRMNDVIDATNSASEKATKAKDLVDGHESRLQTTEKGVKENDTAIKENRVAISQEKSERELGDQRTLFESKSYTDSKFAELKEMVQKNRKETFAGIASALAASQVPQVTQGSAFSIGAGVGGYQGQTAVAIGLSARFDDNVLVKLTTTADTQRRIGFGVGYAVEW